MAGIPEREWFTESGQALMLLIRVLSDPGRQVVKDLCMENASCSVLGADYRRLLEAINTYERGSGQLARLRDAV